MAELVTRVFLTISYAIFGYLLKRFGVVTREDGAAILKFVVNVTLPALLILTLTNGGNLGGPATPYIFGVATLSGAFAMLAANAAYRLRPNKERALLIGSSTGVNLGTFAYPFIEALWGFEGLRIAALYDIPNGILVFGFAYALFMTSAKPVETATYAEKSVVGNPNIFAILKNVLTFPPMSVIILSAVVVALSGTGDSASLLPSVVITFLAPIAAANRPLVLVTMGILFQPNLPRKKIRTAAHFLFSKYSLALASAAMVTFIVPQSLGDVRHVLPALVLMPVPSACVRYAIDSDCDVELATCLANFSQVASLLAVCALGVISSRAALLPAWVVPATLIALALVVKAAGSFFDAPKYKLISSETMVRLSANRAPSKRHGNASGRPKACALTTSSLRIAQSGDRGCKPAKCNCNNPISSSAHRRTSISISACPNGARMHRRACSWHNAAFQAKHAAIRQATLLVPSFVVF
mmetsp:Transcript_12765/g.54027  ORF Transcript_12765/g.54027 Transcript_12765/m.54027 type:complete len:469 (+) Transcript_12765:2092-3498(+)